MNLNLKEVAETLKNAKHIYNVKSEEKMEVEVPVQLIYAFNGTGKTRLSRHFKDLLLQEVVEEDVEEPLKDRFLYYNAFTEDLFFGII